MSRWFYSWKVASGLISSADCAMFVSLSLSTCWQMAPVMVTGKSRTMPRPRFSLFLCWLNNFNSFFSSSSRELQYWGYAQTHTHIHLQYCYSSRKTNTDLQHDLLNVINVFRLIWMMNSWKHAKYVRGFTSLSWAGSWCKSCLIRYRSPGLFTYGTLSSGIQLKYW